MSDGGLRYGCKIVGVREETKVLDQRMHVLGWRRDKCGGARIVATAPNPILFIAYPPTVILRTRSSKEETVCLEKPIYGDLFSSRQFFDRPGHGFDVSQDFLRGYVTRALPERACGLRTKEPAAADL